MMSPIPGPMLILPSIEFSRREFVASSVILGLSLSGCAGWTPNARFAHTQLVDPALDAYRPVLDGLIRSVLAFDDPSFPALSPEAARNALLTLFPIEQEPRFLTLQRGFALFDQVDLFPHAFRAIVDQEEVPLRGDDLHEAAAADQTAFAGFADRYGVETGAFSQVSLEAQRAYLRLWMRSRFVVRRQFARSAKSLITIAAYSLPVMHEAMGYAGPLMGGADAEA